MFSTIQNESLPSSLSSLDAVTNSDEFIASDYNVVLELLAQSMAANEQGADTLATVAEALTNWLRFDPDGSRAAVKGDLLKALSLHPGSVPDVAPDAGAPPLVKHREHELKASALGGFCSDV